MALTPDTILVTRKRIAMRNPTKLGLGENVEDCSYDQITSVKLEKGPLSASIQFTIPGMAEMSKSGKWSGLAWGRRDEVVIGAIPKGEAAPTLARWTGLAAVQLAAERNNMADVIDGAAGVAAPGIAAATAYAAYEAARMLGRALVLAGGDPRGRLLRARGGGRGRRPDGQDSPERRRRSAVAYHLRRLVRAFHRLDGLAAGTKRAGQRELGQLDGRAGMA